jgi:hypothetical protein
MSALVSFLALTLRSRVRRIIGLTAFALVFIAAGATARIGTGSAHGHVELDRLFEIGGTTLVSALILIGWLVGRIPMIATLVLVSGMFSDDRAAGHARLYAVRPRSLVLLYGARLLTLCAIAFAMSAIVLPAFDLLILNQCTGAGVFPLIVSQVLVYGSLTALLSVLTRADAWVALFLGILAAVWYALRRMDFFQSAAPAVRETVTLLPAREMAVGT